MTAEIPSCLRRIRMAGPDASGRLETNSKSRDGRGRGDGCPPDSDTGAIEAMYIVEAAA